MAPEPFDAFRYAHARRREVVWMSQNTNHLVPPSVIHEALARAIAERRYEGYPYAPGEPELHRLVRADLGLPAEATTAVTAGGTESLYMLTRALLSPGDEVVASDPSYLIIHKFIELSGAHPIPLEIYHPPFRLTAELVESAIGPKTKMILLIDPLNPLGSGYPDGEVRAIAEIARDRGIYLLNDVTYRDFADAHSLAFRYHPEGAVTIWSVSKNCGMAGLRLGGLAGPAPLLKKILPYNTNDLGVNVLAQVAAVAALSSKSDWFPQVKATTRSNQETIRRAVERIDGLSLPVFPSQANMFAIDVADAGISPEALQEELLVKHGVFVRAGSYLSPKFGKRFVRASFSNPPEEVAKFAAALPMAVAAVKEAARAPLPRT